VFTFQNVLVIVMKVCLAILCAMMLLHLCALKSKMTNMIIQFHLFNGCSFSFTCLMVVHLVSLV